MAKGSATARVAIAAGVVVCVIAFGVTSPASSPTLSSPETDNAIVQINSQNQGAAALAPKPANHKPAGYAFLMKDDDGAPARWNPCSTITWQWADATNAERELAATAFARVSRATGLRFEHAADRPDINVHFGSLRAGLLGYGSFYADRVVATGGKTTSWVATSGELTVAPRARKLSSTYLLSLLMHEIGHVVGLGHVKDKNQVMFKEVQTRTTWGAGDLAGFQRVGRQQGCVHQ